MESAKGLILKLISTVGGPLGKLLSFLWSVLGDDLLKFISKKLKSVTTEIKQEKIKKENLKEVKKAEESEDEDAKDKAALDLINGK